MRSGRYLRKSSVKAWVPLTGLDVKPFDQTSGALAAIDQEPPPAPDLSTLRLIAQAIASNSASLGMGGTGGGAL